MVHGTRYKDHGARCKGKKFRAIPGFTYER
jgi:hypothetical protein